MADNKAWTDWSDNSPLTTKNLQTRQKLYLTCIILINIIAILAIFWRLALVDRRLNRFRFDDISFAIAGGLLVFPLLVTQIIESVSWIRSVEGKDFMFSSVLFSFGWLAFPIIMPLIKLSLCVSFLRLTTPNHNFIRVTIYAVACLSILIGTAEFIVLLIPCVPLKCNVMPSVKCSKCIPWKPWDYTLSTWSIISDLTLALIALRLITISVLWRKEKRTLNTVSAALFAGVIAASVDLKYVDLKVPKTSVWMQAGAPVPSALTLNFEILAVVLAAALLALSPELLSHVKVAEKTPDTPTSRKRSMWLLDRTPRSPRYPKAGRRK